MSEGKLPCRPVSDMVLLEVVKQKVSSGGVIMPEVANVASSIVLQAMGPTAARAMSASKVEIGDKVLIDDSCKNDRLDVDGRSFIVCSYEAIRAVMLK